MPSSASAKASRYDEDKKRKGIVTHAAAINARRDCELVAGVDLNNKQRQLFRKRYPKVKVYSNTRELFRNEQIDLLIIATPPQSRYESIKLAAHHKIKGLIIEKPLAANLKEGKLIYQLLKKS